MFRLEIEIRDPARCDSFRAPVACFSIAALALLLPSLPKADSISIDDIFTFQLPGLTYSWELPASPTIPPSDGSALNFVIPNVAYSVNGSVSTLLPNEFDFLTTSDGGGFALFNSFSPSFPLTHVVLDKLGPQFFTGSTSAPTFLPGTYSLDGAPGGPGTLTIRATPEPASLLLIGSGVLAFIGLRGRKFLKRPSRPFKSAARLTEVLWPLLAQLRGAT